MEPLFLGRHNFHDAPSNQTIQVVMDVPKDNAQVLSGPHKKKITLSAQILLESLCATNLIKHILEPCYPKLVGIRLVIYQSWAIL